MLLTRLSAETHHMLYHIGLLMSERSKTLQVSMASEEESLTFDLSSVWEWSLASSSKERSSSGKGALQYWKELYVQSSLLVSSSACE